MSKDKKEVKQEQETLIDDPSKGTEPIMPEPKSITIAGTEYQFHRLTMSETLAALRIFSRVGPELMESLVNDFTTGNLVIGNLIMAMTLAMGYAKPEVYQIMSKFLGVPSKLFDDPEKFPASSLIDILYAMKDSQDVKTFFTDYAKGKLKS